MSNDCSLEMMLPDAITAQMTTYRGTGRAVAAKAISERVPARERPGEARDKAPARLGGHSPDLSAADLSAFSGVSVPNAACWIATCNALESSW